MAGSIELGWGLALLILGVAFFTRPGHWAEAFVWILRDPGQTFLFATLALVVGLATILGHPRWTADWHVLVTVCGWSSTAKAVAILLIPRVGPRYADWLGERPQLLRLGGAVWVVGGVALTGLAWGG